MSRAKLSGRAGRIALFGYSKVRRVEYGGEDSLNELVMDAVAISLALLKDAQGEQNLKALARKYIADGRRCLFERHRAGADGLEVASAWSTVIDHLIRHLFTAINAECAPTVRRFHAPICIDRPRRLRPRRVESPLGHRHFVSVP